MFQRIRRQHLILISGLLSLACVSVITIVMLILRTQPPAIASTPQEPVGTPGPQPTHTVTFVEVTGLSQYRLAEAAAMAWAEDAQLVGANADWPQILDAGQVGEPTKWAFRFYSPSKQRLFFAVASPDKKLQTVEHIVRVTLPPRPIEMEAWLIDSPTALATWLDYGGSEILRTNPGLEVVIQLRTLSNQPNPVWMVIGFDKRTEETHITAIDASEGTVVTTSPES